MRADVVACGSWHIRTGAGDCAADEGNHEKARVELFSAIALREGTELLIESVAADIIVDGLNMLVGFPRG